MAKGKKTGGRQKGTLNKITGVQKDFLDAWDKAAGPKTAVKLLKDAIAKAMGYEVVEKTYARVKGKRVLIKEKVSREFHYEPLGVILPYIAKKMPVALEAGELGDGEITIVMKPYTRPADARPVDPARPAPARARNADDRG